MPEQPLNFEKSLYKLEMSEMKLKNAVDKKQTTNERWVEKNYIQSTPV
jgi:hypothetical protein